MAARPELSVAADRERATRSRGRSTAAGKGRPDFYSVAEAALLFRMSEMTVYRAIREGQLPAVRIRGRLIVPARAIEDMVTAAVESGGLVDAADWVSGGEG